MRCIFREQWSEVSRKGNCREGDHALGDGVLIYSARKESETWKSSKAAELGSTGNCIGSSDERIGYGLPAKITRTVNKIWRALY